MVVAADMTVDEIVDLLALSPHPEGGFYRETFRDDRTTTGAAAIGDERAASTAIYFLLPAGVVSRWHRVDAVEIWHWYAGAALELATGGAGVRPTPVQLQRLGPHLRQGERPQGVVRAHHWQQARSLGLAGAWTLVGCTVAPSFTFEGFDILTDDAAPD